MKLSLRMKILGSFALLMFLCLGVSMLLSIYGIRLIYSEFSDRQTLTRAYILSDILGEWMDLGNELCDEKAAQGMNENGSSPEAGEQAPEAVMSYGNEIPRKQGMMPHMDRMPGRRGGMMSHMDRMPGRRWAETENREKIIITDDFGRVIFDTSVYGQDWLIPEGKGIPIMRNNQRLGYLYMGSMLPQEWEMNFNFPLQEVRIFSWIITLVIFLLAMLMGLGLSSAILKPVRILKKAAESLGIGDFSTRVQETGSDELGVLSRSFNFMASSIQKADQYKRRLIADSAHELRTPVSLICARIEMIQEGVYPMNAESLSVLSAESQRLARLVEALRDLSELESGQDKLSWEEADIGGIIRSVVEVLRPETEKRSLVLETEIETNLPLVRIDIDKFHQLMANLLTNAQRYAQRELWITVHKTQEKPYNILISIEDDGPGIPEGEREMVFERYYRVESSRTRDRDEGSGLGLAISREIVRLHGGRIEVGQSTRLGGAALSVCF